MSDRTNLCNINLTYRVPLKEYFGTITEPYSSEEITNIQNLLLKRLPEYYKKHGYGYNNRKYDILVNKENTDIVITIKGEITVNWTIVDSNAPGYHYETDGETSYEVDMSEDDFRDIFIISAFKECASDIIDRATELPLSECIDDNLPISEKDVGYPDDEDIMLMCESDGFDDHKVDEYLDRKRGIYVEEEMEEEYDEER